MNIKFSVVYLLMDRVRDERLDYACQKIMGMPSIEFYNREYASEEGFQIYPHVKEVIKFFVNTLVECTKYEIYEYYVPYILTMIQFGRPYQKNADHGLLPIDMITNEHFLLTPLHYGLNTVQRHESFMVFPLIWDNRYGQPFNPAYLLREIDVIGKRTFGSLPRGVKEIISLDNMYLELIKVLKTMVD